MSPVTRKRLQIMIKMRPLNKLKGLSRAQALICYRNRNKFIPAKIPSKYDQRA